MTKVAGGWRHKDGTERPTLNALRDYVLALPPLALPDATPRHILRLLEGRR